MNTKHLLLSLLALLGSTTLHAYDADIGGIYYNLEASTRTATVTYNNNSSSKYTGSITIPATVTSGGTTYNVTSVGYWAFGNCSGLTSITIPNSVTSIGNSAFYGCRGLTSITIPNSVTSIGNFAFSGCSGLTSITIPNSVTSINIYAFQGCSGLTSITIPNSVTSIGIGAFSGCSSLTSIQVETGNTTYDSRDNCNAIIETATNTLIAGCQNTTIPNSVTSIEDDAFFDCTNMTSITIPESVTSIGSNAFEGCSGLTSITIPNSVTSIGSSAFEDCSGLTSFTIPNVLTTISPATFYGCSGLTSIIIPESVTSISWGAFTDCSSLADITFPSNLSYIDFSDDYGSVFVFDGTAWYNNQPDGMVYAGNVAYRYKGSMPANTNITLRDGTLGIGAGAFEHNSVPSNGNLSSITIPASVTTIGDYAFSGCSGLTSVVSKIKEPFNLRAVAFEGISSNCVLTVPKGKISAYNDAGWTTSVFKGGVVEETEVEIGSSGYATYSSTRDLDFSGMTDIRAYIASGFSPSTGRLVLTRVDEVPAGEGLYIVGDPGTYVVPTTTTDMLYSNFLKGVTTTTTIYPTEGSYTNFILSTGSHGVGFYTLSSSGELAAGKAYLQLPTASVSNVKAIRLAFDDDDPTALQNIEDYTTAEDIYNLQGQKVSAPGNGLYIINGKKILFK